MQHQQLLLRYRLHRYEAHVRPRHRFTDRFSIACVVLVRLNVGLHKLRRHQLHPVAELCELACPVMGTRARLDPHQACRRGGHSVALECSSGNRCPGMSILPRHNRRMRNANLPNRRRQEQSDAIDTWMRRARIGVATGWFEPPVPPERCRTSNWRATSARYRNSIRRDAWAAQCDHRCGGCESRIQDADLRRRKTRRREGPRANGRHSDPAAW
jgi:hypothetical protein